MNAQWLIYTALNIQNKLPLVDLEGEHCAVCGIEIERGIKASKVLSDSFTNHDEIRGEYVCEACANLFKSEEATKLRRSSFVANPSGVKFFHNSELSKHLFSPPDPPFVFCYTTSFKKHNAFRAVLNFSKDHYVVTWEDRKVEFDRKEAGKIFKILVQLYTLGFTKTELETGNLSLSKLTKFPEAFFAYESVRPYLRTSLFELLVNAIPAGLKDIKRRGERGCVESRGKAGGQAGLFDLEKHGI